MKSWRNFRLRHRLTQKQMADAVGISVRGLIYIEQGKVRPQRLHQEAFLELVKRYREAEPIKVRKVW